MVEGGEGLGECVDIATVLERIIKARNRQSKKKEIFRHTTICKCEQWKTKYQENQAWRTRRIGLLQGQRGFWDAD